MSGDGALRSLFTEIRTIAVLGAKDVPGHPVDRVGRYLMAAGYTVVPVHPKRKSVWGLPVCAALGDIREAVDCVTVFRASEHCFAHAEEALSLSVRPRLFWMQLGISNAGARDLLAEHGIVVVENACIMIEHARLFARKTL